ncbi:ATP-binding protein [Aeromicrobium sp.]|uniref:sensor histidine kinase n=1 Tax=Aeromicrobium sp. TaxID=1871063 RepID=UPI0030BAA768
MRRPLLLVVAGTGLLVATGFTLGFRLDNLHNGLLALSFTAVGSFVLHRQPGQREAKLFLAAGVAHAVMFFGRQVGQHGDFPAAEWVAWFGVWPLPLVLALAGAAIMGFPDGRLPGPAWTIAFRIMLGAAVVLSMVSALWPVEYARTGIVVAHPFDLPGGQAAESFFDVARPVCYTAFQLLWAMCVVARLRRASTDEAHQLRWFVSAVAGSAVVLLLGLATDGSPRAGVLAVSLVPVAAGIAIVESAYEVLLRELRAAAKRIVTAQDDARRRIERDLHDGAQHRLVTLGIDLGRLVDRAERAGDPELVAAAVSARRQLLDATAELRELARGIHPAVLTQDGLAAALERLVDGSTIPVRLAVDMTDRCPPEIEATAYFVASEALTNATRHSGASQCAVSVVRTPSTLRLDVTDDGRGGVTTGGGLAGMADRVTSLGGRLAVESPADGGTCLRMELPCA